MRIFVILLGYFMIAFGAARLGGIDGEILALGVLFVLRLPGVWR